MARVTDAQSGRRTGRGAASPNCERGPGRRPATPPRNWWAAWSSSTAPGWRRSSRSSRADRDAGPRLLDALAADPLVESLLLVHDLHPLDTDARIRRALEQARPRLGAHADAVEYLGIDDRGVARLRLTASGHGCGSASADGPADGRGKR